MHIALVALPWAEIKRPSFAISALAAYLGQAEPSWTVTCHSEYLRVAEVLGIELYREAAHDCNVLGETLNVGMLYPERRGAAIEEFYRLHRPNSNSFYETYLSKRGDGALGKEKAAALEALHADLRKYEDLLDREAERLSQCDVVGLTTSFGQVFSNLAFAKKLKANNPSVKTILGGSSISTVVGPSLLEEYDYVDYIVQGEGEVPLLSVCRALARGAEQEIPSIPSVVTRENRAGYAQAGAKLTELDSMDCLPIPDFSEYHNLVKRLGIDDWAVPIEGSRGCWWDRVKKTGNAKHTCYFCNLNIQWNGYREKSAARVAQEMKVQSERYARNNFYFLDNIIRHKGLAELSEKIRETGRSYQIFYEMRANISPHELLLLEEAGVNHVQIGIEGLSTSLLKRIGKGTTAIKNLEVMRTIYELNILHFGNLILAFPGSTQEEADETLIAATEYAIGYEPLNGGGFLLGRDNTVYTLRDQFPITNVRTADFLVSALPEDVGKRLKLLDLAFDHLPGAADWSRVFRFCKRWRKLGKVGTPSPNDRILYYRKSGETLSVVDLRGFLAQFFDGLEEDIPFVVSLPRRRVFELRGKERELYLFCTSVRSIQEIEEQLTNNEEERRMVHRLLDLWQEERLVFREGSRVLSLAIAETRDEAAKRIRAQFQADELRVKGAAPKHLQLVV